MKIKEITIGDVSFQIMINPATEQGAQKTVYDTGMWEPNITEIIMTLLKPSQTFIDVGAAAGWFSLLASQIVGSHGKVIAFEPNPVRYRMIQGSADLNGVHNIMVSNNGLGDKNENAFIGGRCKGEISETGHPIKITTLDSFLRQHKIDKVDLIKIDIEGVELRALQGMAKTIRRNKDIKIICELHPKLLKKYGDTQEELLDYVQNTLGMKTENVEWRYWMFTQERK